jgi:hypothetical protein
MTGLVQSPGGEALALQAIGRFLMRKRFHLILLCALCGVSPVSAPAKADSLSCQSVNGDTLCTGSGGLSCRTVAGRMACAPGSSGSCKSEGDRIICRNGTLTQTFRTKPPKGDDPAEGDTGELSPQPENSRDRNTAGRQRLSIRQGPHQQSLSIEQNGQELHIQNGAVDLTLE